MKFIKTIVLAIIVGIFSLGVGNFNQSEVSLSNIILYSAFSGVDYYPQYIVYLTYQYMPLLIFQLAFGLCIYQHFCTASVYFFSRNTHRIKWFLKEIGKLYVNIILYLVLFNGIGVMIISLFSKIYLDDGTIPLIIYYIIIYSLYLLSTTLAINVIAILFSSNVGFIVVESVILSSMCTFLLLGRIKDDVVEGFHLFLLKSNLIANLVFPIHSSKISNINQLINEKEIYFELDFSIIYYLVICIFIIAIGCYIVKKREFTVNNKEF